MSLILGLSITYFALVLIWQANTASNAAAGRAWHIVWAVFSLTVFALAATRTGGSDWENYEHLYLYVSRATSITDAVTENFLIEPGYVALNYLFSLAWEDRRALVVFEAAVSAWAIWLLLCRVKGGPILVAWLFPLQIANILPVRQHLATSLFIIGIVWMQPRWRWLALVLAPLTHLSSVLLIGGRRLVGKALTLRTIALAGTAVALVAIVGNELIDAKLVNYLENADDLSSLSGLQVFLGKTVTLLTLLGLHLVVSQLPSQSSAPRPSALLYTFAFLCATSSYMAPALARLTTPVELLLAWQLCIGIASLRRFEEKVLITSIVLAIAASKMTKITLQLGDIYEVCFLCQV